MIDKTEEFLKKHKPLSPEEIKKSFADAEQTREKYSKDLDEIEANLTAFLQKEDPMIDPGTEKVVAWVREAPIAEYQTYTNEFKSALEGLSEIEAQKKLDENPELAIKQYTLMANLITKPKHDAKWWSEHVTPDFIALFESTLEKMMSRSMGDTNFFYQQTTGTD